MRVLGLARSTAVVLALTALAVTGCGSSGPSKTSYVAKANAICATYNAKVTALPQLPEGSSVQATAKYLAASAAIAGEETDKLKALTMPKGEKATLTSLYSRQAAQVSQVQSAVKQLSTGDIAGAQATVNRLEGSGPGLDKDFTAYGLNACGAQGQAASGSTK